MHPSSALKPQACSLPGPCPWGLRAGILSRPWAFPGATQGRAGVPGPETLGHKGHKGSAG